MGFWEELHKKTIERQAEQQALAEPSIMDEYIKKSDPAQYEKIFEAKIAQEAADLGASLAGSTKIPSKKLDAAYNVITDFADKGQLDFKKGSVFERFRDKPLDEEFTMAVEKLTPEEMSRVLEENYVGGVKAFLKDHK